MPILFISLGLYSAKLNYLEVDKQIYCLQGNEIFRESIFISHIKVIIPHPFVCHLLVQKKWGDRRVNLMTALEEYYLEIKSANIIQG